MTLVLGATLLALAVVLFILHPILEGRQAPIEPWEPDEALARRRVALQALRDVEYDFATGKLDREDYDVLRREVSAEALEALRAVEAAAEEVGEGRQVAQPAEEGGRAGQADDLERQIARVRAGLEAGTTCLDCGHPNRAGSRFCGSCGAALARRGGSSAGRMVAR